MRRLQIILCIILIVNIESCKVKNYNYNSDSKPISHEDWDSLLQAYINDQGLVNYKGFIRDSLKLNKYLDLLSKSHPNEKNWSSEEQMAYWINAYNAFTVKLIVDHYPTQSIKNIKNGIPFVNTVWDIKFIKIENATYDLNNIEHGILRSRFKDPRIHAAINCASISCPKLQDQAFSAQKLNKQLDEAAWEFLNDTNKNMITPKKAQLSKIFNWYSMDFDSVRDFVNKYSDTKINRNTKIEYLEYNWGLNEAK
ncbi:MAG: DUF547 domain-containing protein [Saprospiraceae bacterium]|nr:DUF547 domain-containing protein [Saprospiraceae bacterium]